MKNDNTNQPPRMTKVIWGVLIAVFTAGIAGTVEGYFSARIQADTVSGGVGQYGHETVTSVNEADAKTDKTEISGGNGKPVKLVDGSGEPVLAIQLIKSSKPEPEIQVGKPVKTVTPISRVQTDTVLTQTAGIGLPQEMRLGIEIPTLSPEEINRAIKEARRAFRDPSVEVLEATKPRLCWSLIDGTWRANWVIRARRGNRTSADLGESVVVLIGVGTSQREQTNR